MKIKATGFGREDLDPTSTIQSIMDIDPTALMVGTDLPSTGAARPFNTDDVMSSGAIGPKWAPAVFWGNAAAFYLAEHPSE